MDALVQCAELRHSYGKKEVLHGLSFSVESGGIVGLLGKNGAGKSTAINILMGFLRPDSGKCSVLGCPSHSIAPAVRARIGLLHEGFVQYDFMSIAAIERYYAAFYPAWNRDLYYDLVNRLDVPHSRRVSRLSCGQRSQIVLGLILAQQPDLMILDDYSMGLDVGYRRLFLEFLREYVDEHATTVLLTSHVVQELDEFLDELIILHHGTVLVKSGKQAFMDAFRRYDLPRTEQTAALAAGGPVVNIESTRTGVSLFGYAGARETTDWLRGCGVGEAQLVGLAPVSMTFEDAFIGLTGRY